MSGLEGSITQMLIAPFVFLGSTIVGIVAIAFAYRSVRDMLEPNFDRTMSTIRIARMVESDIHHSINHKEEPN